MPSPSTPSPTVPTPQRGAPEANNELFTLPTYISTPTKAQEQEWIEFFKDAGVSPPKKINKSLRDVIKKANDILWLSGYTILHPKRKPTWDDLTGIQKAGMAFLINEGIDDCFRDASATEKCKKMTYCVFDEDYVGADGTKLIAGKDFWRNLIQFIRKGGDEITEQAPPLSSFGTGAYRDFRSKHEDVFDHRGGKNRKIKVDTIFSLNHNVEPLLRLQTDDFVRSVLSLRSIFGFGIDGYTIDIG